MSDEHAKQDPESKLPQEKHIPSPSSPATRGGDGDDGGKAGRNVCGILAILILIVGLTALIVYLIYRPHKPRFTVAGAAIYNLNFTSPPLISTSLQFTLLARNPNERVSMHYSHLSMYVTYKDQMITPPLALPPLYLGKKTTVAIAPVLGSEGVPVAAEVANALKMDESYGVISMRVVLVGKLRWKAGAIRTGEYGLYVKCDVWLGLKRGSTGQVPLLSPSTCKVDV